MKTRRIIVAFMAVFVCIGGIVFASGSSESKQKVIGFIPQTLDNQYFVIMVNAAKQEAKKLGVDLLVQAGQSHSSSEAQLAIVEDMITRHVGAICIVPNDPIGVVPALKEAESAGIPVVNLDDRIDAKAVQKAGLKPIPFIGTDNFDAAKAGGEYALKNLGIAGKEVAILTGIAGQRSAIDRKAGMEDALKGKVQIVAEQSANWEVEQGYTVFQNILQAHPKVAFLFASNDNMAIGAERAIKEAGRKDILVMGNDAIPAALAAIENGTQVATIAQFPAEVGIQGVQMALKLINGEKVPLNTATKTEIIDKSNVATFRKYLKQFE